jgi:hypothetical protein
LLLVTACGGAVPASAPVANAVPRESVPLDGLEVVALGDPRQEVLRAFPAARLIEDRIVLERTMVEDLPADVAFLFEHGNLHTVRVTFGEDCFDGPDVYPHLVARFGPRIPESAVTAWRKGDHELLLGCFLADDTGWVELAVRRTSR